MEYKKYTIGKNCLLFFSCVLLQEEDNVKGMLRNLPEVGLIDLETYVKSDS